MCYALLKTYLPVAQRAVEAVAPDVSVKKGTHVMLQSLHNAIKQEAL